MIVAIVVLAIAGIGFAFTKMTSSGPPIPEQPRSKNYQEGIPDYVKNAGKPGNTGPGQSGQPAAGAAPTIPTGANGGPPGLPPGMKK